MKLQGQNISDTEGGDNRSHIFYLSCLAVLSPGVIIGLVSGWHSNMLKTFLRHPSFFVLPAFTPFTFTSSKKTCLLKDNEDEGHLKFSVKASLCNLFASFLTSVITFLSVALHNANQDKNFVIVENALFLLVPFSGSLLSLFFLYNARPTTRTALQIFRDLGPDLPRHARDVKHHLTQHTLDRSYFCSGAGRSTCFEPTGMAETVAGNDAPRP